MNILIEISGRPSWNQWIENDHSLRQKTAGVPQKLQKIYVDKTKGQTSDATQQ